MAVASPCWCCTPCGKQFTTRRAHRRHLQTNGHQIAVGQLALSDTFPCHLCGREFTRDFDRGRHLRTGQCRHTLAVISRVETTVIPAKRAREQPEEPCDPGSGRTMGQGATPGTVPPLVGTHDINVYSLPNHNENDDQFGEPSQHQMFQEEVMDEIPVDLDLPDWLVDPLCEIDGVVAPQKLRNDDPDDMDQVPVLSDGSDTSSELERSAKSAEATQAPADTLSEHSLDSMQFHQHALRKKMQLSMHKPNRRINRNLVTHKCPMCKTPYELGEMALRKHLERHIFELTNVEYLCKICDIVFSHIEDLEYHRRCATLGSCGFDFDSSLAFGVNGHECTGHHPPSYLYGDGREEWSDHERLKYGILLRSWENVQIRTAQASAKKYESIRRPFSFIASLRSCPSIIGRRLSAVSLAHSQLSWRSEPYDIGSASRTRKAENYGPSRTLRLNRDMVPGHDLTFPRPLQTRYVSDDFYRSSEPCDTGAASRSKNVEGYGASPNLRLNHLDMIAGRDLTFPDSHCYDATRAKAAASFLELIGQTGSIHSRDPTTGQSHVITAFLLSTPSVDQPVVLRSLLLAGAPINLKDIQLCIKHKLDAPMLIVLAQYALSRSDHESVTPVQPLLHQAVLYHDATLVETLLKAGAPVYQQDSSGHTALQIATQYDRFDVATVLIDFGAWSN